MRRILAFDPGEVWFGMAALCVDPKKRIIRAETRVLHAPSRPFHSLIDEAILFGLPADVVCEDYRVRPVGHQRWSSGQTLKCIGALRYVAERNIESSWQLVPPGNASTEVPELGGQTLAPWAKDWTLPNDAEWNHAWSAWRVLLRYLMKSDASLLMAFRSRDVADTYARCAHWYAPTTKRPQDLLAPAAMWSYRT